MGFQKMTSFTVFNERLFSPSDDLITVYQLNDKRYVFPIFKNGSTALDFNKWKEIPFDEISTLNEIEIFVRDPKRRMLSGIHTFLKFLEEKIGTVDKKTALYFIKTYFYLDRHFSPQVFWLLDLGRIYNGNIKVSSISSLPTDKIHATNSDISFLESIFEDEEFNQKANLYCQLDKELLTLQGKTMPIGEIFKTINKSNPKVFDEVFNLPYITLSRLYNYINVNI